MRAKIREHIRANAIGYVALFIALGGGAYALQGRNTVDSRDIINGQVRSSDVKDNGLTGNDVNESALGQVPSAVSADSAKSAKSADSATNADKLGGMTAAQLDDGPLGFARVNDSVVGATDTVDEANSQAITDANVSHPATGSYCFHNLGFTPHVANVTPENDVHELPDMELPPDSDPNCPAGTDAAVELKKSNDANADGTPSNAGFSVVFY
jgi:hypothetical protein